ncbi:MAG: c-type cytochrome [Acidobacteria bacterium]|nr:c-type cytochrome [Acidobacteriota bacterium]
MSARRGPHPQSALRTAYLVASVAGVAFFALSVALLGAWPARMLRQQSEAMAPPFALEPTASERRGRAIYASEGCAYCHTQQIRYVHADMERFGRPTLAWETRRDSPHLWGTRRIGPDLSRAGGTRPPDWQYAHLFDPRALVPASVMPAYPWLFDGAPTRPTQAARDLVAYLESLGRARALAGSEGEAHAQEGCACPADEMQQMAFEGPLNAHPARARRDEGPVPPLPAGADLPDGQRLYAAHCATCHGETGGGDGPGAGYLLPVPTRLAEHEYSTERLAEVLWNGVAGSAMPAWRSHTPAERAAIVRAVQALWTARAEPAPTPDMLDAGARVFLEHCAQCHGEGGDGKGFAEDAVAMAPASFTRQRPSLAEAVRVIREGVPGSPMAPWTPRLSTAEILSAAHYVRSLYPPAVAEAAR